MPSSLTANLPCASVLYTRPPVSVSGTGAPAVTLSGFSRQPGYPVYRSARRPRVLSGSALPADLPAGICAYPLQPSITSDGAGFTPASPLRPPRQCRNLNRLSICLAFRLIIRPRLTLIRLALIRNPWSFGGGASNTPYRYSFLHLLFHPLQPPSRKTFAGDGMLPYHFSVHGFGGRLDARLLSTPGRSTGELLRTPWMNGCFQANIPAVSAAGLR